MDILFFFERRRSNACGERELLPNTGDTPPKAAPGPFNQLNSFSDKSQHSVAMMGP